MGQALVERVGGVVGADHDGHGRPLGAETGHPGGIACGSCAERGPRRPITPGETEVPSIDRFTCHPPVVGPREHAGAGHAALAGHSQRVVDEFSLDQLADRIPFGVRAQLADDQWPVAGQVLEARQVTAQSGGLLEEDVEHDKVESLGVKVFGGGIVPVGPEHPGIHVGHRVGQ